MTARPPIAQFGDAIEVNVTQDDGDAAADLIERYFPTNNGMLSLAGSFRRGHLQGVWPYAFARHRTSTALPLAQPAAVEVGEVERLREALRKVKQAARYVAVGDGYFDPYVNHIEAVDAIVDAALAPAAIASGREGAE